MTNARLPRALAAASLIIVTMVAFGGCTPGMKRMLAGEQSKRQVYLNLMTPEQAATLRAMEKAEVDEQKRILYVQEIGVYQQWAAAPEDTKQHILKKRVVEGMKPVEVQMAWGPPAAVETLGDGTGEPAGTTIPAKEVPPAEVAATEVPAEEATAGAEPSAASAAAGSDQTIIWHYDPSTSGDATTYGRSVKFVNNRVVEVEQ